MTQVRAVPSSPAVSRRMAVQARSDTKPELAIRRELHRRGLRYRVNFRAEPGLRCSPDIVFTKARVAVFVHGCFWHRCPVHGTSPAANSDWWRKKLDRNVERDRDVDRRLESKGWQVLATGSTRTPYLCSLSCGRGGTEPTA